MKKPELVFLLLTLNMNFPAEMRISMKETKYCKRRLQFTNSLNVFNERVFI